MSKPTLETLPTEILLEIFDYLTIDQITTCSSTQKSGGINKEPTPSPTYKSGIPFTADPEILSIRLVSRKLSLLARPFLYRHFHQFTEPNDAAGVGEFLRILDKEPYLASYVHHAHIYFPPPWYEYKDEDYEPRNVSGDSVTASNRDSGFWELPIFSELVGYSLLLPKLINLQHLSLTVPERDPLQDICLGETIHETWLNTTFPALTSLSIHGTLETHIFAQLLISNPTIQTVAVDNLKKTGSFRLPEQLGLTSLELRRCTGSEDYLRDILSRCHKLRSLAISCFEETLRMHLIPVINESLRLVRNTLQDLKIHTEWHPMPPPGFELEDLVELKRLDVDLLWGLERLPHNLQELIVRNDAYYLNRTDGLGRVADALEGQVLNRLSNVEMKDRKWRDELGEDQMEMEWQKERLMEIANKRSGLKVVCEY
ncbi:hypothetical protein BZA77DRAFT_296244 [Pyronema omphalodes]|nr:hypothetical protein BZA77DRAFT_296244 [Pyronema omphalodes]